MIATIFATAVNITAAAILVGAAFDLGATTHALGKYKPNGCGGGYVPFTTILIYVVTLLAVAAS